MIKRSIIKAHGGQLWAAANGDYGATFQFTLPSETGAGQRPAASPEQLRTEIAERKRAEEVLREQASLLNLTHDAIFVRDMDGVVAYWNRGAQEFYGWTAEECV